MFLNTYCHLQDFQAEVGREQKAVYLVFRINHLANMNVSLLLLENGKINFKVFFHII